MFVAHCLEVAVPQAVERILKAPRYIFEPGHDVNAIRNWLSTRSMHRGIRPRCCGFSSRRYTREIYTNRF
jgi:hypothetical protein